MDVPDVSYARACGTSLPSGDFGLRVARGRRVIVVNPRGVGLSDRPRGFTVESRMDDILAVLDAVGIERAALLGMAEAAATCAVFAASHPERVEHLMLHTPYARGIRDESGRAAALERLRDERARWGSRELLEESARRLNPQWADDENYLHWFVWHH